MKKCLLFLLIVLLLAACTGSEEPTATNTPAPTAVPPTPTTAPSTPTGETQRGQATVDSIQILTLESFPVQINVRVRGELADSCTMVEEIITQQNGNNFQSAITTIRPGDAVCTTESVPFEEVLSLDVNGLDAGTYNVTVNGISGSFTLDVDNRNPEDEPTPTLEPTAAPTATPIPIDPESAAISGRVWHDLCAVVAGETEEEAQPTEGCSALEAGGFLANGLPEPNEEGIEGLAISLGEGECPSTGLATTETDANGEFGFAQLPAGTYCVSVDPLAVANGDILLPGAFSAPQGDFGEWTIAVEEGQVTTNVDFGWDFEFLPIPEVDPESCINSVLFVEDLAVPDDTAFAPNEEFVKSWRLQNNGTCPWTEDYTVVAIDEEPFAGDTAVSIGTAVAPGQTIDVSVTLNAPEEPGTYRSNWQMGDAEGAIFGVNGFAEDAFWLQIVVDEEAELAEPNSAVIGGVVWRDFCTLNSDGSPTSNCVETEEDSGFFIADGSFNFGEFALADAKVTIAEGTCPSVGIGAVTTVLETVLTDVEGLYSFEDLAGGEYCVFIDAFDPDHLELFIPGDWSWPGRGNGLYNIFLADGEERLDVDFGWDDLE